MLQEKEVCDTIFYGSLHSFYGSCVGKLRFFDKTKIAIFDKGKQ